MITKTLKVVIIAAITSLPLLILGLIISFFFTESLESLSFILFVIGAIPIVLFSPGLFSRSTSGAIHTPKVIFRLVDNLKPKKETESEGNDPESHFRSSLNLVLAGFILWIISYFV